MQLGRLDYNKIKKGIKEHEDEIKELMKEYLNLNVFLRFPLIHLWLGKESIH